MAGPYPWDERVDMGQWAEEMTGKLTGEGLNTAGDSDDEVAGAAEALATEVGTFWRAFSQLFRVEMGAKPMSEVLAWVSPMVCWIEGA